jgi:hypothetical protein
VACGQLHSYLEAITKPLDFSRALSDIGHAFTYTTMQFSSDPRLAEQELCR